MKNPKLTVLGFLFALTTTPAMAATGGAFFEPMLTYQSSDAVVDYNTALLSNSTGTQAGAGFGARVGMHANELIFVGIDARYSQLQLKDGSNNYDAKSTGYNFAPTLGFQMPIVGLRLWGSYILGGEYNPESSNGVDFKFKEANGYRVGAGFRVLAVSLNLEYQDFKYNDTEMQIAGVSSSATDFQDKGFVASVSFPLEF